jgi:hypothetical protein
MGDGKINFSEPNTIRCTFFVQANLFETSKNINIADDDQSVVIDQLYCSSRCG